MMNPVGLLLFILEWTVPLVKAGQRLNSIWVNVFEDSAEDPGN